MNEKDCGSVFAALSQYFDQELPPESCQELERHIQDCAPCVEFVESLKKSIALGRGYEPLEKAPALAPEVRERLRQLYARQAS